MPPRPSSGQSDSGNGPTRMSHSPMANQETKLICLLLFTGNYGVRLGGYGQGYGGPPPGSGMPGGPPPQPQYPPPRPIPNHVQYPPSPYQHKVAYGSSMPPSPGSYNSHGGGTMGPPPSHQLGMPPPPPPHHDGPMPPPAPTSTPTHDVHDSAITTTAPTQHEASQQSTLSNASAASGEDSACTPAKSRKEMVSSGYHSHPTTPQSTAPSPGAASLNSMHEEYPPDHSPTWPRTPASPVSNNPYPNHHLSFILKQNTNIITSF
ncbi:hypothetical protein O3M35_003610 [Rhynocoris fuscipes]|uniref:Uncharacterized protein n=1 Tax=Rhynocoris fuscipes TaxID=488301 RepID=A0AAW1CJG2_9HEMI